MLGRSRDGKGTLPGSHRPVAEASCLHRSVHEKKSEPRHTTRFSRDCRGLGPELVAWSGEVFDGGGGEGDEHQLIERECSCGHRTRAAARQGRKRGAVRARIARYHLLYGAVCRRSEAQALGAVRRRCGGYSSGNHRRPGGRFWSGPGEIGSGGGSMRRIAWKGSCTGCTAPHRHVHCSWCTGAARRMEAMGCCVSGVGS